MSGDKVSLNFSVAVNELTATGQGVIVRSSQANNSSIRLDTANGFGSTNTVIRRFTNLRDNFGDAITYVDSVTDGASFTINEDGLYHAAYVDNFSAGGQVLGISKNSTQLTTNVVVINDEDILTNTRNPAGFQSAHCGGTWQLQQGDVIRPHTGGAATGSSDLVQWSISKVGTTQAIGVALPETAYVSERQPSGTDAGTFTAGFFQTRVINTLSPGASFIRISLNQLIIEKGTYHIKALIPGYACNQHVAKLRNITDGTDAILGQNSYAFSPNGWSNAVVEGTIRIEDTTVFELQHRCLFTVATFGLGFSNGFGGDEIYTHAAITKVG